MSRVTRRSLNVRLLLVGVALFLAWTAVGVRLFEIQAVGADEYTAMGEEQRVRREVLAADRGTIFDRDGNELAVTVDAITVYANPRQIADPAETARQIGPLLALEIDDVERSLRRDSEFSYVARRAERRRADEVRALDLPGIYFTEEPRRTFPSGTLAAHVIGFVRSDDNVGLEGIELHYDEILSGTPGEVLVERDPGQVRIPLGAYDVVAPDPGADLVLTIDREIQFEAEAALAAAINRFGAAGGSAIVLEVATGEVLAMANLPTFDPNDRADAEQGDYRNRAVVDVYEPGSTQKLLTVAAALEEGLVRPADVFDVPLTLTIHDKTYEDVGDHPAVLTVADIVAYSSNIGTILIQGELGNETHHGHLASFGIGRPTGIDFPGEAEGVLYPPDEWCVATCGPSTAIGYRVSVTALQMAAAFGAIANDGVWVKPHLVREILDGEGARHAEPRIERRVVSQQTAAEVRLMLAGVVEKGTGQAAQVPGYTVGGKTGTTEKYLPDEQRYGDDVVASFIGIAPIDDPRVVIAVTIDSPAGGEFGGTVAAPAFAEIALSALHQLGVPPRV